MDPKQALLDALQSMADGDRESARESLDNYWQWRRRGGFDPQVDGASLATAMELLCRLAKPMDEVL